MEYNHPENPLCRMRVNDMDKFGEPWHFGRMPAGEKMILTRDGRYVANIQIYQTPRHMGEIDEDSRVANAKRIIACVNACAGMDDPEKEIAECDAESARLKADNDAHKEEIMILTKTSRELCADILQEKKDNAALRAAVEKHEWAWSRQEFRACPECKNAIIHGHAPGCEIARLLKKEKK